LRDAGELQELSRKNIFLIGFMAVGKSTVGKKLAHKLNYEFVDLDSLIVQDVGLTIPEIFSKFGEKYFRTCESEMVKKVCNRKKQVVATGGGVVINSDNIKLMKKSGLLICLEAQPENILSRVELEGERPLLECQSPLEKIKDLLMERDLYYQEADFFIDTSCREIPEVVSEIIKILNNKI